MTSWRSVGRRTAVAAGWVLAAGMSVVGLSRLFRSESEPALIGVQGFGMWLLLPAYPLAVAAVVTRKKALAGFAVALALGNVVWASEMVEHGRDQPAPAGAATLRLVSANLLVTNPDIGALGQDLAATGADVIVLQEVSAEHLTGLASSGLLAAYPYQVLDPRPEFHGSAILSTLPLADGRAFDVAGSPMTRADITIGARIVRLINVHTVAPLNESQAVRWRAQLDLLSKMKAPEGGSLVMAGDFNATLDHAPMSALVSAGMRDAFSEAGQGIGATWPQSSGPMPALMRLDHVLVSDTVVVMSAQVQPNPGSDHHRLSVELALPPAGDPAVSAAAVSVPQPESISAASP